MFMFSIFYQKQQVHFCIIIEIYDLITTHWFIINKHYFVYNVRFSKEKSLKILTQCCLRKMIPCLISWSCINILKQSSEKIFFRLCKRITYDLKNSSKFQEIPHFCSYVPELNIYQEFGNVTL